MAQIELTATLSASSSTTTHAGIRFSVGSSIKAPPPPELRPRPPSIPLRLPNGEEVVVLRPARRA